MPDSSVCRELVAGLAALVGAVVLCLDSQAAESGGDGRAGKNRWGSEYFTNTELATDQGAKVYFYDDLIKDRVVMINFIFTSCGDSCPMETARLKQVYDLLGERMGRDVFFYSISIDPEFDTPEVLAAYKEKFKIGRGWTFLTGKESEIIELRRKLSLYQEDLEGSDDHNLSLIVGNEAKGKWIKRSPFDNPGALARILSYRLFDGMVARNDVKSYSEVPELPQLSEGAFLFQTRCESCHTLGGGEGLGPDLIGVTARRERSWLARWIREPDKMIEEGDPQALALYAKYRELAMPNLRLEHTEVNALLEFLVEQDRERGIVPIPGRQARLD